MRTEQFPDGTPGLVEADAPRVRLSSALYQEHTNRCPDPSTQDDNYACVFGTLYKLVLAVMQNYTYFVTITIKVTAPPESDMGGDVDDGQRE